MPQELTAAEEDALFVNGQFTIRNRYKGLCGGFRLSILTGGDVGLASDHETDSEYLVWQLQRGSKTRTGQDGMVVIKERLNRKGKSKSRCPLEIFYAFRVHRSDARCQNQMLLFFISR